MKSENTQVRTRIAPSPTGWLHLGTARSALFNYLFARQNSGKFILRIEDTDLERSDKKYTEEIVESLNWLGINWDEGPVVGETSGYESGGKFGPYFQTKRANIYEKHIGRLIDEKKLFWCYHSKEELLLEKQDQMGRGESPRHICSYAEKNGDGADKILRFKAPYKIIQFDDVIRGKVEFDCSLLGDIGVARDEKTPLYNLAVVIDDYEMKITHVIRGEDHISNTPKQIILAEALGFIVPKYAHLPLILGQDKSKLSKRHGATSIRKFREQGYLAEALVNYLAFLGWNPGSTEEIFSMESLIKKFDINRVQKGGAIFNIERLNWLNGHYIRGMKVEDLIPILKPHLVKAGLIDNDVDKKLLQRIVTLERDRLKKLSDIVDVSAYLFKIGDYDKNLLIWKNATLEGIAESLKNTNVILSSFTEDNFISERILVALTAEADKRGDKGIVFWPLRVALSGQKASAGPTQIAEVIGIKETLNRINHALEKI